MGAPLERPGAVWRPPQDPTADQAQQQGPIGARQKVPEEEEAYFERRQSGFSAAPEDEPQRMRLPVLQPDFRAAAQLLPSFHRSALLQRPAAARRQLPSRLVV